MHNWVKWCIVHNLSIVPYVALLLLTPFYLIVGMVGGVKEWMGDFQLLNKEVKREVIKQQSE